MNFPSLSSNMNTEALSDRLRDYEYFLLTVIDVMISFLVVAPCTVASWRGLWEFLEHKPEYFPEWIFLIGASFFHFLFSLFRSELLDFSKNLQEKSKFWYSLFSRVYIYLFLICCIVQWRCIWRLLDNYFGVDDVTLIIYTVPSLIVLYSFRLFKNVLAPPYYIEMDYNVEDVFNFGTLWSYPASQNIFLYVMDSFFSVFVIGSLVVFVWRGMWGLVDIYLYKDDQPTSAAASLVVGYTLVFSTFLLQPLVKRIVSKISGFWRVFIVDVYLLFSLCGTVNVWRGIWVTLDCYFLTEHKVEGFWLSHIVCFLILVFINSSNSILVRGVYIDAEEDGGKCVDFPCYYLRLFFQSKRRKKMFDLQRKQDLSLTTRKSDDNHISCETLMSSQAQEPLMNHMYHHHKRASIIAPPSPAVVPREINTVV